MILLSHFGTADKIKYFSEAQNSGALKYSELKETLAKDIADYFEDFREKKSQLLNNKEFLADVLADGSRKATVVARETLMEVKQKIGLV
jgi:tryptophanyl-tRNA synthetase